MRFALVSFLLLGALVSGVSQALDYAVAPQEALGFSFGATESSVTDGLTASHTEFRLDATRQASGLTRVVIANQTLDKLDRVTFELSFSQGILVQIRASLAYTPEAFQGLLTVLGEKYGVRRSTDGGYHYNWFYQGSGHQSSNQVPDFAIVLANDPVDKKTVTLTYADNLRKSNLSGPPGVAPTPAKPSPEVPALDPKRF